MKNETTDLPSKVRDYLKQVYPGYSLCVRRTCWTFGSFENDVYEVTVFPIADNNQICVNFKDEELSVALIKLFMLMSLVGVYTDSAAYCPWTNTRPNIYRHLLNRDTPRERWPFESHILYDFLHPNTTQQ